MEYWSGKVINRLQENEIFVYGSNPQGINGLGAAKAAMSLSNGAKNGIGRGFNGSNAYALVTKSLNAGYREKSTGILYDKDGYCSVSPEQIRANIDELYSIAIQPEHQNKKFLISYQYETWPNGSPKKSLNGYTSQEILEMFVKGKEVPPNIVFHDSYKSHLENIYRNKNNSSTDNDYFYFFHLTSPFSNFHPALFELKERWFISNEQLMMYAKAMLFKDNEIADKILNVEKEFNFNSTPNCFKSDKERLCFQLVSDFRNGYIKKEDILNNSESVDAWNTIHKRIKELGRKVKNYDEDVWSARRKGIVKAGARAKFSQNADLLEKILNIKGVFVEASPYDKIWGIGLSANDAKKTAPERWPGKNLLGELLTDLQQELKEQYRPISKRKL